MVTSAEIMLYDTKWLESYVDELKDLIYENENALCQDLATKLNTKSLKLRLEEFEEPLIRKKLKEMNE